MKKILLPIALLCIGIASVNAQKANVRQAVTKAFNVESPDPKGAKEAIEAALVHPESANDVKTWFEAGRIFNKIQQDETEKQKMGMAYDKALRQECIVKVLPCLQKANEMDNMPNEKGKIKPKYTKKIKYELKELYSNYSIELAANDAFTDKDFAAAAAIFDIYINIPLAKVMQEENILATDTNYTFYKYNAGIAHYQAGEPENIQTAIKYFQELTESNYNDINSVYQILLNLYLEVAHDTTNYVANLEKAVVAFPKEAYYIEQLINYYVEKKENEKAINHLNHAIENEPDFDQYYFLRGRVKEEIGEIESAIEDYKQTLAINPEHIYAYIQQGNIIYNKAVDIDNQANDIKDNKEYQKAKSKANALLTESLPFYEKVLELKPDDYENIRWLRSIYYRLDLKDKYNDMEKRLKALGY